MSKTLQIRKTISNNHLLSSSKTYSCKREACVCRGRYQSKSQSLSLSIIQLRRSDSNAPHQQSAALPTRRMKRNSLHTDLNMSCHTKWSITDETCRIDSARDAHCPTGCATKWSSALVNGFIHIFIAVTSKLISVVKVRHDVICFLSHTNTSEAKLRSNFSRVC